MYFDDHPPPHFHASYQGFEAFVGIETGEIVAGTLPKKAARIVRQWALDHQAELVANWQRGISLMPMEMIPEPTSMIKLVQIKPDGDATLWLTFSDGTTARWSAADYIARDTVVTRPLADLTYFSRAFIEAGALAWPNGFELSADALHRRLDAAGTLTREPA